jgi:hypothetical protein
MRNLRRGVTLALVATVLTLAGVAAGCGDDDGEGDGGGGGSVAYIHLKPRDADSWESGGYEAVSAMAKKYDLSLAEQTVSHDEAPSIPAT